jgi:hypothetical protein
VTGADAGLHAAEGPPPLLSRPMVLLLAAAVGSLSGFYLLLSVVPLCQQQGALHAGRQQP